MSGKTVFCNNEELKYIFDKERCAKEIRETIDSVKKSQAGYRVLTGQSYGPEELAVPAK